MCQKAGVPLTPDLIAEITVAPLHEGVVREVLDVVQSIEREAFAVLFSRPRAHVDRIVVLPVKPNAAKIEIEFLRADADGFEFAAGEAAFLYLPTDVYGSDADDPVGFVASAVRAVVEGNFEETIYVRRGIVVKIAFTLDLGRSAPFTFIRRDIPASIRGLGGRLHKRSISYRAYV